ncbi:Uncharacterised protein [Mycobacterium tuberculosis]|nr:Uncharacterised protein [Mycobacterium tuberculosis]
MPAKVEGQAHATQTGNTFGAFKVTLLAPAPTVHEQHPRHFGFWAEEGATHLFVVDIDRNAFASSRHKS